MSLRKQKIIVLSILLSGLANLSIASAPVKNKENRFVGYEQLKHICSCESWGDPNKEPRQFDEKGRLIVGQTTPEDKGQCQISLRYHSKELKRLGLDATKENDNLEYAKILYDKEGSKPWKASKGCWSRV